MPTKYGNTLLDSVKLVDLFTRIPMPPRKVPPQPPTVPAPRSIGDGHSDRVSVPQTDRIASIEAALATIQHTLDVQFKRMAAMQAEIDQLSAKKQTP